MQVVRAQPPYCVGGLDKVVKKRPFLRGTETPIAVVVQYEVSSLQVPERGS